MKKINFIIAAVLAVSALVFWGCSKSSSSDVLSPDEELTEKSDIAKILYLLEHEGITTAEDGSNYLFNMCGSVIPMTRGDAGYGFEDCCYENISMEAAIILSNFQKVVILEDDTEEVVKERFYSILDEGGLDKYSEEYVIIKEAIDTSFDIFEYLIDSQPATRSQFWQVVGAIARCVGGTVGSAGLGALAGAGAGTVTLPVIGTVSGTALGAVCGGLVGAATFC